MRTLAQGASSRYTIGQVFEEAEGETGLDALRYWHSLPGTQPTVGNTKETATSRSHVNFQKVSSIGIRPAFHIIGGRERLGHEDDIPSATDREIPGRWRDCPRTLVAQRVLHRQAGEHAHPTRYASLATCVTRDLSPHNALCVHQTFKPNRVGTE